MIIETVLLEVNGVEWEADLEFEYIPASPGGQHEPPEAELYILLKLEIDGKDISNLIDFMKDDLIGQLKVIKDYPIEY